MATFVFTVRHPSAGNLFNVAACALRAAVRDKAHIVRSRDWLYKELREYPPEAWRLTQGVDKLPLSVQVMPTVVGVWENYKLYLSRGVELAKWHRHVPSYFTFDDHELVNDIWGSSGG